jgi:outer membrane protein TolC
MCTMIASTAPVQGMGKGAAGWFPVTAATVGYDHTTHSAEEHALLLDFTNYSLGLGARIALELDLDSGRALLAQLTEAIEQAEASGV